MSYDLHTPFGIIPGQVTPADQLQAQTFAAARNRAAQDDASSAQMHALRQAIGDDGGGDASSDKFFSQSGPFGIAPKDTGAVDLGARNAAVMQRQMNQADLDANAFRNTGLDAGTRERMAQGGLQGIKNQREEDNALHPLVMQMFQDAMGGGKPGAAAPAGPMNPNMTQGGINLGAMGGSPAGAPAAPAAKGIDYRQLAAIAALRNHQAVPDFAGQDAERAYTGERNKLDLEQRRSDLTDSLAQRGKKRADEQALETDPASVSAKAPEIVTPLAQKAAEFVTQDTKMIGRDPTGTDIQNMVDERDRAARALALRGLSPQQAQAEANRAIVNALGPNRNDMNNGRTLELLTRLGISGPQQATPDAGYSMNDGPG